MAIRISRQVVDMLAARGLLPNHCSNVEIHIPPNGPMVVRFDVYITDEHLRAVADAFAMMADESKTEAG